MVYMKGIIQIYILARDRPKYLKEAIESVLNQKTKEKIEIIVSDNSENNTVGQIVSQYFSNKKLKYIKRSPPLSAIKHFQLGKA